MKFSLLVCLCAFVCVSQAYFYQAANYTASLTAWQVLKPSCYVYTVVNINDTDSDQTVSRTTIKVRNERVISRSYRKTDLFYIPGHVLDSWEETTPSSIGSNGGDFGTDIFPAVTLDQVYTYCKESILTQDQAIFNGKDGNSAAFETSKNGVIAYCAFYNGQCAGFCGGIINIDSFATC
jgi:hypothetical protein